MKSSLDPPGRTGFANHGKHAMKHANHGKHTNQGKRTGKRRIIVIFLLGVSLIATLFFNNYEMQDVPSHTQSANGAKERDSERDSERDFHTSEKGEESEREHLQKFDSPDQISSRRVLHASCIDLTYRRCVKDEAPHRSHARYNPARYALCLNEED